jgi:nucleotide-binding universal stress UspA family protein
VTESRHPVLLCYDGSDSSAIAIEAAGRLLAGRPAVVCHVWTGLSQMLLHADPGELPGVLREAAEELDQADREAADKVAAEGVQRAMAAGFEARPLPVRRGRKAWRTLLAEAERHNASVIVTGAHGWSGLDRAILGSFSTAVVHHSTRPMLVVPAGTTDATADGPLLLCYDGSDPAKHAISSAAELCTTRPALVLHLWESWATEAPALAGASAAVHGMCTELDEIADEQSADCMRDGVELARQADFQAEGLSERATGPMWQAVLDAADEHDCSGIVAGSRGLTGISAALGSVSNGIVHHSRLPVLVVPPEER